MRIKKAELLAIATKKDQYPPPGPPEVAFAGRSNVGKSSLLNLLTNRKRLAFVSGNPGKTQTINFYAVNDDAFRIVDLPGYGYAKISRSVTAKWGQMVEAFLEGRETLRRVAILVDIRHEPSARDVQLYEYLKHYGLSGLIVATKADKVSRNVLAKQVKIIRQVLSAAAEDQVICVSALKKTGTEELLAEIGRIVEL
ncbi:MAG: ribosome biogenesis GTP-binding protein YihA/YsxC [Clostridiales Family XIII bacterium]|jgi:GTP-binding protein|nr:ribosome biogenesis GTP-binding protein YihA/YsxC [Clostridiales Family XIII bacterium]